MPHQSVIFRTMPFYKQMHIYAIEEHVQLGKLADFCKLHGGSSILMVNEIRSKLTKANCTSVCRLLEIGR